MRYTITNQHINYYIEHGYIEFEEILDAKLIEDAKKNLTFVTNATSPIEIYKSGRDLFRKNVIFEKIAKDASLAQIVKLLTKLRKIQLAFDQAYVTCEIFDSKNALEKYFSFQNLACLAIIRLDNADLEYKDAFQAPVKFSNVVFVNPRIRFDLSSFQVENQSLLFIGYGSSRTIYIHNQNDLNNATLKHFGYVFGDCLNPKHNPYI